MRNFVGLLVPVLLSAAGCGGSGGGSDASGTPSAPPAGVTVSATSLDVTEGAEVTYTMVLASNPNGNVTITPISENTNAVTVSDALTFNATNWNTAQTVTVTAVEENNGDGNDHAVNVTHTVTGYNATAAGVMVNVTDNDMQANGIYRSFYEHEELSGEILVQDGTIIGGWDDTDRDLLFFQGDYVVTGSALESGQAFGGEVNEGFSGTVEALTGTIEEGESITVKAIDEDESEHETTVHYQTTIYERAATLAMWEGIWEWVSEDQIAGTITFDADGTFNGQLSDGCTQRGTFALSHPDRNLYEAEWIFEAALCAYTESDTTMTGFAYIESVDGGAGERGVSTKHRIA